MSCKNISRFLRDESGGYTIWSLIWFSLYVAMGGLAVDMTDAYRNQTLLQATADVSSLAAVMSLPDQDDGTAQALAYSAANMSTAINGNVLKAAEVIYGNWNFATRTFAPSTAAPDAARVITRRDEANLNPLATNFLRIIGLQQWNISVEAIATAYVSTCRRGGFVAGNKMDVTSGNYFYNDICIHGQNMTEDPGPNWGIDVNNDNTYERRDCYVDEEPPCGVIVSTPYEEYVNDRPNVYEKNPGLYESLWMGDNYPTDALNGNVQNIIDGLTDPTSAHFRDYIPTVTDPITGALVPQNVVHIGKDYVGPYDPGTIYLADQCQPNQNLQLPSGAPIREVVIVADCIVSASNGLILEGVVVASTATSNGQDPLSKHAINLSSAAQLGSTTYCSDDPALNGVGGVEVYALASAHVAASLSMNGLRAVVGGDFEIAAQGTALGVSVQAGDNITFTAAGSGGGTFGLCPNGTLPPGEFALDYKLVL